jgi:hypothetical protein
VIDVSVPTQPLETSVTVEGLTVTTRIDGPTATLVLAGPVTVDSVAALRIALDRLPAGIERIVTEMETSADQRILVGTALAG